MKNAIQTLRIQNFKSIKDVTMTPRRVNIIIGEPNVGKSNILEAMSLLGGMVYDKGEFFMKEMIRYQQANQLFYDNVVANAVSVETARDSCYLRRLPGQREQVAVFLNEQAKSLFRPPLQIAGQPEPGLESLLRQVMRAEPNPTTFRHNQAQYGWLEFDSQGKAGLRNGDGFKGASPSIVPYVSVKPYLFEKGGDVGRSYSANYLAPPHGDNLKDILQTHAVLRQEAVQLFKPYGLKMLLRMASNELEIAKEVGELMYTYPYSSVADTLQRLIFYLAAIESNDDAVLLFEEPEAHSYPVYVSQLARRMVASRNNQFFVVTHSPHLITEVLEEMLPNDELAPELALFVAYYEDYQTKVRQLSDEEVVAIRADGLDVFYNMARFVPSTDNAV